MSKTDIIPYNAQSIDEDDIKAVSEALRSPYLTTGPLADEFEQLLAKYLGVKHVIVCSNGTAALHLSMLALGIGPGDKVITSPITFLADANAPRFCGADVLFADIDPKTINLDPQKVREILEADEKVKAIIPVHFAGQACDMRAFSEISKEFNVHIIEDGCHALGGSYIKDSKPVKVGSCADSTFTTFSFHPIKNITTGEGGAITTNDDALNEKLRLLRSHGNTRNPKDFMNQMNANTVVDDKVKINPWYYEMQYLSYNYRLTDFQSALGISQLSKLDHFISKRNQLANYYDSKFSEIKNNRIVPLENFSGKMHGRHLYVVKIKMDNINGGRNRVMSELLEKGIQTQVHYIPIHYQPNYQQYFRSELKFPIAENYYHNCLSLPLYFDMTQQDVDRVVLTLNQIIEDFWIE